MSLIEIIKAALKAVWNFIKKIVLKVVNWFKNIYAFFKDRQRIAILKENKNAIAVAIKEKLEKGDYQVINCLFDKEKNEIINEERDALIMTAEDLDKETKEKFKNKEMIVLE